MSDIKRHVAAHIDQWSIDPTLQDDYFMREDVVEVMKAYKYWIVPNNIDARDPTVSEILKRQWFFIRTRERERDDYHHSGQ